MLTPAKAPPSTHHGASPYPWIGQGPSRPIKPAPVQTLQDGAGLGFWGAIVGPLLAAGSQVYASKQAKALQQSAQKHEEELARIQAETEARKAAAMAQAAQATPGKGAKGGGMNWKLIAGIGAAGLLGTLLVFKLARRNPPRRRRGGRR